MKLHYHFSITKNMMKILLLHLILFLLGDTTQGFGQNTLAVPFTSGFIGDVNGNNSCINTVYLSSLGCTGIYFAQSSNTTQFVAQGNDIIGSIVLTDAAGVEHTIPGFVKWRAPSGTVTSLVFSPSGTTVLSTSGGGTYTVTTSKYIGIIFNGKTIDISTGTVTGNASSTGLLDVLNSYLSTFPSLTVPDYSINESAGTLTVTVSLTQASTNEVRVRFTSTDGVAVAGSDYTFTSGQLIFAPNQTTITLTVNVLTDLLTEPSELFYLNLFNPVNASITNSTSNITILDNPPLGVALVYFTAICITDYTVLEWETASEKNSDYFILERKTLNEDWESVAKVDAAGESMSSLSYVYHDNEPILQEKYYRLNQVDKDGNAKIYDPIVVRCESTEKIIEVFPNPSNGDFNLLIDKVEKVNSIIRVFTPNGQLVYECNFTAGDNDKQINIENALLCKGVYFVQLEQGGQLSSCKLIVQ